MVAVPRLLVYFIINSKFTLLPTWEKKNNNNNLFRKSLLEILQVILTKEEGIFWNSVWFGSSTGLDCRGRTLRPSPHCSKPDVRN